jgi:hypothetical protein
MSQESSNVTQANLIHGYVNLCINFIFVLVYIYILTKNTGQGNSEKIIVYLSGIFWSFILFVFQLIFTLEKTNCLSLFSFGNTGIILLNLYIIFEYWGMSSTE